MAHPEAAMRGLDEGKGIRESESTARGDGESRTLSDVWKCVVDDKAVGFLLSLPARESTRSMNSLEDLARTPLRSGAEFGKDSTGCTLQAFSVDKFEVIF